MKGIEISVMYHMQACGHLFHHSCTNRSELIAGYCYSRNIKSHRTVRMSNPCPAGKLRSAFSLVYFLALGVELHLVQSLIKH